MSAADRIEKLATGLYNDLEATDQHLKPWPSPWPDETKQQKLQLILDAFEQVGLLAMDVQTSYLVGEGGPEQVNAESQEQALGTNGDGWAGEAIHCLECNGYVGIHKKDCSWRPFPDAAQQEQTPH